jgi:hypothetical protein
MTGTRSGCERYPARVSELNKMTTQTPKKPNAPPVRPDAGKLRGNIERDEGPSANVKPGYRNSDEVENTGDARHDDPVGT